MYKGIPIKERQNTEESIRYLHAQRYAYKIAKCIYMWRMFLSIVWPIIAVILYFACDNKFANEILIVSSLILVATFIMELYEKKYTVIGATIQEQFDTTIFNMKWNLALVGEKISHEKIYTLAEKEKTEISKLKDWYTGINTNDEIEYTLKAQKTNIAWSIRQKEIFRGFLLIMAILILLAFILIASWKNFLMTDFFITLFFPTISLFIYLIKGWVDFSQQVNELKRITSQINSLLESEKTSKYHLRFIQDSIYVYGRVPNNIIPDVLYNKLRKKLEEIFKKTNK
ncbi:S-4TM family putative pore-forming effector [Bacillus cereus]|uniref:S-4TM family putative pore-forming effector n=1 Tax=Bacillus cereus TaxID=1396 RepID=UPI000B4B9054|nr:S-4TM family putative pore-forming effector [Bacillus cereus]MCU4792909.1 S-4TM family putative pore-forming effector [Bacillus cereus]